LPANRMPNYESMQAQIDNGYLITAEALGAPVAPVGYAWQAVRNQYPQINLWQDDGSHPTEEGTYLAAWCLLCRYLPSKPGGVGLSSQFITRNRASSAKNRGGDRLQRSMGNPIRWRKQANDPGYDRTSILCPIELIFQLQHNVIKQKNQENDDAYKTDNPFGSCRLPGDHGLQFAIKPEYGGTTQLRCHSHSPGSSNTRQR